jgi:hypothetical protein
MDELGLPLSFGGRASKHQEHGLPAKPQLQADSSSSGGGAAQRGGARTRGPRGVVGGGKRRGRGRGGNNGSGSVGGVDQGKGLLQEWGPHMPLPVPRSCLLTAGYGGPSIEAEVGAGTGAGASGSEGQAQAQQPQAQAQGHDAQQLHSAPTEFSAGDKVSHSHPIPFLLDALSLLWYTCGAMPSHSSHLASMPSGV